MIYKIIAITENSTIFARIDDDGLCRLTCTQDNQQFLKDIKEGVELVDADGNVVTDFVKELP